jgi:hypothetical protein
MAIPIPLIVAGIGYVASLGSAGIRAASSAKKKKSSEKLGMESKFSSSQPTGGGYSQGPNSIGSVIGAIGQAAGKVGQFAMENPELTKAALDTATNVGSQLIKNKQNKNKGAYMKGKNKSRKRVAQDYARNAIADRKAGRTREANYEQRQATRVAAGEAPTMMGYNPLSKHMGGRGAEMMGKKPMMMGGDPTEGKYKSVRQAVKDVKNNPLESHKIANDFGRQNEFGGRSASNKQKRKYKKFATNKIYKEIDFARQVIQGERAGSKDEANQIINKYRK